MGASAWNILSFITGLLAWGLPIVALLKFQQLQTRTKILFILLSVSACATAIFGQLAWQTHLVAIQDYSAMQDTSQASLVLSAILLAVTVILNAVVGVKLWH